MNKLFSDTDGWADNVTNHNRRHFYLNGVSLCGKAYAKTFFTRYDNGSSGYKYAKDCCICIRKLAELKLKGDG